MIRRDAGLIQPEPVLEIVITLYDNRTVGFQTNSYRGKAADPGEVVRILQQMAQGIALEANRASQPVSPETQEMAGLALFSEADPATV